MAFFLGSGVGSQESAKSFVARAPSPAAFDFACETTAGHPHGWPFFRISSHESVVRSQRTPLWRGRPRPRPLTLLAKRPPAIRMDGLFFLGSGVGSQESAKSFVARAPSPAAFDFARETTAWPFFRISSQESVVRSQ